MCFFKTPLKNISQNGNLPQIGVNKKKLKPPPSIPWIIGSNTRLMPAWEELICVGIAHPGCATGDHHTSTNGFAVHHHGRDLPLMRWQSLVWSSDIDVMVWSSVRKGHIRIIYIYMHIYIYEKYVECFLNALVILYTVHCKPKGSFGTWKKDIQYPQPFYKACQA